MNIITLKVAIVAALVSTGATGLAQGMTQEDIRNGYIEHAALAQFHRWFQFYERPEGGFDNALDILTEDVTVTSTLGVSNGREHYAERVLQLPASWRNAHVVKNADINVAADGSSVLTANVIYQNMGMSEDGTVVQGDLTYTVNLSPSEGSALPMLSNILIEQNSATGAKEWVDAYPENRALSLVHYYLSLIENPTHEAEPFRELFADGFNLNFSSGTITDFAGFEAWLAGPASLAAATTHVIQNFSVEETSNNTFTVKIDFDWAGILPDGTEMVAKTRHEWTVTNDVMERFARILVVDVEILEPFRPKQN